MTDLNDPNVPEPESPEPVSPPEPPPVDLDAAYRAVADNEGWDPRVARFEMEEFKRRREEFDREKREFKERTRIPESREPAPDFGGDPYAKMLYEQRQETAELKRMLLDRENRESEKERREELIQQIGGQIDSAFNAVARQAGMTREQIGNEATRKEFFDLLTDMYPDPEMIDKLGSDRAVRNAFRSFKGANGNTPTRNPYRDPRAAFVIPGAPTGSGPSVTGPDMTPQRPGETIEQYSQRIEQAGRLLQRQLQDAGLRSLPKQYSSE